MKIRWIRVIRVLFPPKSFISFLEFLIYSKIKNSAKSWYLYILKCSDNSLYTGITNDVKSRVKKHNAGKGAKYTRTHLPVKLLYSQIFETKSAALRAELRFKKLPRAAKLQIINTKQNLSMLSKKAVLFDLDDTLYQYEPMHKAALKAAYKELRKKIKISEKRYLELYNISKAETHRELAGTASSHNRILYFQRLIEKTHNTIEPNIVLKLYDAYWNTYIKLLKPEKATIETLKKIKKAGLGTAIVSDLTTRIQLRKMKKLGITNYIDVLVTSEEAGTEKPHPIMFLLALNKLNLLPADAVLVGDNPINDIEGGNAVGLDTILLIDDKKKRTQNSSWQKPDFTIRKIEELQKVLVLV